MKVLHGHRHCIENGHDWESVCTIDTELVDGKLYGVVLSECVNCGQEMTWDERRDTEKDSHRLIQ